jgi:hypothetical protein
MFVKFVLPTNKDGENEAISDNKHTMTMNRDYVVQSTA